MVVSVVQRRMVVNVVQDESNCSTVNNNKSIHLDRDTWIVPGHMPTGHIPTGRQTSARVWETVTNQPVPRLQYSVEWSTCSMGAARSHKVQLSVIGTVT